MNAPAQPTTQCQQCGAPLDRTQRYCVNCAARVPESVSPASRYFTTTQRTRRANANSGTAGRKTSGDGSITRGATVVFFVLLPIAVAIGILVGRGSGTDEDKLLEALADGPVVAGTADDSALASTGSDLLPSDFSLDEGFTVKLELLPIDGTDEAAVDEAKGAAEDDGAKDVGIINPGDFSTTPDQGQDDYILYSGEFEKEADAEKALKALEGDFADAEVIEVTAAGGKSDKASDQGTGGTKVLAESDYGVAHQVEGIEATDEAIAQGKDVVNDVANSTGKDFIETQQGLPDIVVVGEEAGDGSSPTDAVGDN